MTARGRDFLLPQPTYGNSTSAYDAGGSNMAGYGMSTAANGYGSMATNPTSGYQLPTSSLVGSSHDDLRVMYGRTTGPQTAHTAQGPANQGAEWRLQLAEYASSRLKDEEVMRLQADLRSARSEVERLNSTLRQAQARAADELRREQERLGSALRQVRGICRIFFRASSHILCPAY
jgi:hypothetical protein